MAAYDGPVCYQDGWHWSVVSDENGNQQPDKKLHLEDSEDGTLSRYRFATAKDTRSWHDRKHKQFVEVQMAEEA